MSVKTQPILIPATRPPRILLFDSGLGGLSVLREVAKALPSAAITYVADDAGFPYGAWAEAALVERVVGLMDGLIATHAPDLVVIACSTAATLVLGPLRARFDLPFVGTVPAIKPAAAATRSGLVSVLATPGTVRRDYTKALIDTFASHVAVTLVGSQALAGLAEAFMRGEGIDDAAVAAEIAPCFVERDGRRTDTIVLGCTHYPFLVDVFRRLSPWPVTWVDPAPAIARRVAHLIGVEAAAAPDTAGRLPTGRALFTSGRPPGDALAAVLAGFGLCAAPPA